MINLEQQKILETFAKTCNREQLVWVSGYLLGLANAKENVIAALDSSVTTEPIKRSDLNIYYATETGNAKLLSTQLMKPLRNAGFKVKAINLNSVKGLDLKKDKYALFLVSTHGEGDPPESAVEFMNTIKACQDNSLPNLHYAILGLGDKSYEIYCGAAIDLDNQLKRLGATNFQEIALFDVDYADHTPKWIDHTVEALKIKVAAPVQSTTDFINNSGQASLITESEPIVRTGKGYSRLNPITGTIKNIVNLNDRGSNKETYHIEIVYDDEIVYTPGDAVGIILPKDSEGKEQKPRLYSIASAPMLHEGEIHLTVALATYIKDGEICHGIASYYLSKLMLNDKISFYISQNHLFNLPPADQDLIMIGPGTGIAPFRSFVYQRLELGATGRNWIFFGDQHAHCDFLYQAEWQEHLATGALYRMDLAFSRDQEHKVYVQDRMKEQASEIVSWLDKGAAIYVCGSKDPMSKDVEQTLVNIISLQKSISLEQSKEYLANLVEQNRYLKDVY